MTGLWPAPFEFTKIVPFHPNDPGCTVSTIGNFGGNPIYRNDVEAAANKLAKRERSVTFFSENEHVLQRVTKFFFTGRNIRALHTDKFARSFPTYVTNYILGKLAVINKQDEIFPFQIRFFATDNDMSDEEKEVKNVPKRVYVFETYIRHICTKSDLIRLTDEILQGMYEFLNKYSHGLNKEAEKVVYDLKFIAIVYEEIYPNVNLQVIRVIV